MGLFKSIFGISPDDEPYPSQKKDILNLPFYQAMASKYSKGCDKINGASGEFGYEETNPIPVNGPIGETVYLNRLRTKSGVGFMYHRIGSLTPINVDNPVDEFELLSMDGKTRIKLYFDCYHFRRSLVAPKYLTLVSWSSLSNDFRNMMKVNRNGVTHKLHNFPDDLPEALLNSPELNRLTKIAGSLCASDVMHTLSEIKSNSK